MRRSYGFCPTQLDGYDTEDRPFYFRSRGGQWTLHRGETGWPANICGWPDYGPDQLVAYGLGDIEDADQVDALVDLHIGKGWRHATYEEQQYMDKCSECLKPIKTDGSSLCTPCLSAALGW